MEVSQARTPPKPLLLLPTPCWEVRPRCQRLSRVLPPCPLPARRPVCPCMSPRPRAWRCSLCRLTRALKVPIRGSLQLLTCHTAHGPPPRPALSAQCGPAVNRVRPARADTRPHTQERAPRQPQLTEAHVAPRWLPCGCAFKCGRSLLFFRVSSWARGVFCCVCSFG